MNTFKIDLQTLIASHVAAAPIKRMLSLVDVLAAEDDAIEFPRPASGGTVAPRFINLGANGKPTTDDHIAVLQTDTGLIWTAAPLQGGKEFTHEEAMKACGAVDLLGKKDWRAPTVKELLSLIDYERCDPAVDPKHFKGSYGYTWSSTLAKSPAGYAWDVFLGFGDSDRSRQDDRYCALAVRAGQQFGLGL